VISLEGACLIRPRRAWIGALAAALVALALVLALAPRAQAAELEGIHKIQHVVMIMQENRSFDSYFGTYPGANGIPAGVCVPDPLYGGCDAPFYDPAERNIGGPHGITGAKRDIDGGKMDGSVSIFEKLDHCGGGACEPCDPSKLEKLGAEELDQCDDVMGYHDAREIPNYWAYAENYVLQDDMFESDASWSAPEHDSLVSGWSAVCPSGDANPLDCVSTLTFPGKNRTWTDITYLLAKANVSWRYYVLEGEVPDCENDEEVECTGGHQGATKPGIWNPLGYFADVKQDGQLGNIQSLEQFYTAVDEQSSCGLPNVAWVVPNKNVSEHPRNMISKGQEYVTTLINSIMRSPCWNSTAIFLSWDDWGGFYDHVVPPDIDENGYGLRVPGLVISPYAKFDDIDHQQLSHDAYLKFIEDDFLSGARLNPNTDGRPDSRPDVREEAPGLGNLGNDFNFAQAPRAPLLLSPNPPPGPASEPPGSVPKPPLLTANGASSIGQISVTLNGSVNPNRSEVGNCHFEYGTSTSYGASVPCTPSPGAGESPVSVSAQVEGLKAGTAYHFRLVATNTGGESFGTEHMLTTLLNAPAVTSGAPSAISPTSVKLNGSVDPDAGSVGACRFEDGISTTSGASVPCAPSPGAGTSPVSVSALTAVSEPAASAQGNLAGP
jgi:phospholipase C